MTLLRHVSSFVSVGLLVWLVILLEPPVVMA